MKGGEEGEKKDNPFRRRGHSGDSAPNVRAEGGKGRRKGGEKQEKGVDCIPSIPNVSIFWRLVLGKEKKGEKKKGKRPRSRSTTRWPET